MSPRPAKGLQHAAVVDPEPPALEVEGLSVAFRRRGRWERITREVALTVRRGEAVGIVGESGCGKSVTATALAGLAHMRGARMEATRLEIDGTPVPPMDERAWRAIRGRKVGMIFQHPSRALDPAFTVGDQIAEVFRTVTGTNRRTAWSRAVELLDRVGIARAAQRARDYPHTFSGGMCQRVGIAMALAAEPVVLLADEPTTALDVTVQARILALIRELQAELDLAVVLISHDLGVVAEVVSRAYVMYAGQVVEHAPIGELFDRPRHHYSRGLLDAQPRRGHRLVGIPGLPPQHPDDIPGCRFGARCGAFEPLACGSTAIPLRPAIPEAGSGHWVRCAAPLADEGPNR